MSEIFITQLLTKLNYRICGGGKYTYQCYGKNARKMMFGNDDNLLFAECIFDTKNMLVYEISYLQGKDEKGQPMRYVWRHPEYKAAYRKEAALLRETTGYTELQYKQISFESVMDSIIKSL